MSQLWIPIKLSKRELRVKPSRRSVGSAEIILTTHSNTSRDVRDHRREAVELAVVVDGVPARLAASPAHPRLDATAPQPGLKQKEEGQKDPQM